MSARVDATTSRVQSAVTTKKVTKSMEGVVKVSNVYYLFILSFSTKIDLLNKNIHLYNLFT